MKRATKILVGIIISILVIPTFAQQDQLTLRGELYTNHRLFLEKDNDWAWNENRLDFTLEKRSGKIFFRSNIWFRHLGEPNVNHLGDLFNADKLNPWNLNVREAYAEVRGFLTDNIDFKFGRQRVAWGTADVINPTDVLNPLDLEDILDFGRKNGSDALSFTWFPFHSWSLQLVYSPFFRPSNLPVGVFAGALLPGLEIPPGFELNTIEGLTRMPRYNINEGSSIGARLKGFAFNTDFSVSFARGRESLPFISNATVFFAGENGLIDVNATLFYPRFTMIGADMAGSVGSVGIWAEAGLFFPENQVVITTDVSQLFNLPPGNMITETILLEKSPYLRMAVGLDYTTRRGIYFNLQYLKGFVNERGKGNLNDYLLVAIEKKVLRDMLVIKPLAGGLCISDFKKPSDNYAWFYTPEISYVGIDNLEISLGAFIFDGKGSSLMAALKDNNMLNLKARFSF